MKFFLPFAADAAGAELAYAAIRANVEGKY